jgi:hypothetical protein
VSLAGNEALPDGELDEIGGGIDPECLRQLGFVILDGSHGQPELRRDLFHAFPLRDEAQDIALTSREGLSLRTCDWAIVHGI